MHDDELSRLERDNVVQRQGTHWRTTRRWQGAMSRAALRLMSDDEDLMDLRAPIAVALLEIYRDITDDELLRLVHVLAPIEAGEIGARAVAPR
jgi:hypothetical protein